jgi:hypothetical protein
MGLPIAIVTLPEVRAEANSTHAAGPDPATVCRVWATLDVSRSKVILIRVPTSSKV